MLPAICPSAMSCLHVAVKSTAPLCARCRTNSGHAAVARLECSSRPCSSATGSSLLRNGFCALRCWAQLASRLNPLEHPCSSTEQLCQRIRVVIASLLNAPPRRQVHRRLTVKRRSILFFRWTIRSIIRQATLRRRFIVPSSISIFTL